MSNQFQWSKVRFNEYMLGIRESKCGRAKIVKLNPPEGGATTYNEFVPILDGELLPRYYRLTDAKKAIENREKGEPLPKVGRPAHQFTYENVYVDEKVRADYQRTKEAFRARVRNGTTTPPVSADPLGALGLGPTASYDEAKKAYRKLCMEFHPDRNPGDASAEEKFKEIQEAWEIIEASHAA